MDERSSSSEEYPVRLIVSSSIVTCAYAYIRTNTDFYFLLALASCVAKRSSGQDSYKWLTFELKCLVSN